MNRVGAQIFPGADVILGKDNEVRKSGSIIFGTQSSPSG